MLGTLLLGNTAMSKTDQALSFTELIFQWREMDKQVSEDVGDTAGYMNLDTEGSWSKDMNAGVVSIYRYLL